MFLMDIKKIGLGTSKKNNEKKGRETVLFDVI